MATVGIDLGTGSVKVAVVDEDASVRQQSEATYEVRAPQPGWAESHPDDWLHAVRDCLNELNPGFPLAGVGLCGQMHGVVFADEQFRPLRPAMLWADTRSAAQARAMAQAFSVEHLAALGSAAVPGFAATSVAWVAAHEPDVLARSRHVLQPKDWLRAVLGGQVGTDPSDASGTLLADVATGTWDADAVAWSGLQREQLPNIVASFAPAGEMTVGHQRVPVVIGAADTAAVLLSAGIEPGEGLIAVGTGAQVLRILDTPILDDSLQTHTFARAGAPGHGWYRIGAVQNAGLALQVVLRWLNADVGEAHDALDEGLSIHDPIFVPFLAGERTPFMDPDLRGSWVNLGLSTDRKAILRSVLVGLAQAVAFAVEAVFPEEDDTPLFLLGGGTRDERFRQLLADAAGRELRPTVVPAQGVVGAALLASGQQSIRPAERPTVLPSSNNAEILREQRRAMVHIIKSRDDT
jgi:xylulokinase